MNPYLSIECITDKPADFWRGKSVLLRADFNVPESETEFDFDRVDATVPTLQLLLENHARVVVIAHREKGPGLSSIAIYLKNKYGLPTDFVPTILPKEGYLGQLARENVITVMENTRSDDREKENDSEFVDELTRGFDYFVQDAFSVCHREHASIVGVAKKLPSFLGIHAHKEVSFLTKALECEKVGLIVGGAKFDTKLPIIEKFLQKAEVIFIGGALAHTVYKSRGYEIGTSLCDTSVSVAHLARNSKVHVPQYVLVKKEDGTTSEVLATEVGKTDSIMDAGMASFGPIENEFSKCEVIIWNGPLGYYEGGFFSGTKTLAGVLANSGSETIVGGGDTVSALASQNLLYKFTFVSLAGGAMLDYLATGKLVGLDAMINN